MDDRGARRELCRRLGLGLRLNHWEARRFGKQRLETASIITYVTTSWGRIDEASLARRTFPRLPYVTYVFDAQRALCPAQNKALVPAY